MRCQRQNERADSMTRFANPKAMQDFINQYGPEAAMGGNPKVGTRPRGTPTTGGPKPAPIVQQPVAGMRPRGTPTTGGPKPAPTGLGGVLKNKPAMTNKFGNLGGKGLVKNAAYEFLRTQPPLDISKTAGPGAPPPRMRKGGKVSSASKRADGCAVQGKTKGKMV